MKPLIKRLVIWILTIEARGVLRRYKPHIVAVTGNMGKTSAKEAIFTALSSSKFVRKSEKSLNTQFGVPLTIIGRESGWNDPLKWFSNILEGLALVVLKNHYPKWLVLEVGADRPGDIKTLATWVKPDVAVITGIPEVPVHIEFFESVDALIAEKEELAKALKEDGTLVVNGDDANATAIGSRYRAKTLSYGFDAKNDVVGSHLAIEYDAGVPSGMRFRVNYGGSSIPVVISGVVGKTYVYPILAACAVGITEGIDLVHLGEAFTHHEPIAGRMRLLQGIEKTTLIDDTYNASPVATMAALETLADIDTPGRKIAVLGDMLELGKHSVEEHRKVGQRVAEVADMLVTVGIRARGIAQAAQEAGLPESRIKQYEQDDVALAGEALRDVVREGDVVLLKGSQGIRMEKAVKELLAERSQAKTLLVRQDAAWLAR